MSSAMKLQSAMARGPHVPPDQALPFTPAAYVLLLQGAYYFLTGVWPLLSIDTFQMVTGSKTDLWLVDTVGVLILVISLALLAGAWRRRATAEVVVLAVCSAVALTAVDVVFVARDVIARIYLLDAAAEMVLLLAWVAALIIDARTRWKRSAPCL